jgi:hypothetical protein
MCESGVPRTEREASDLIVRDSEPFEVGEGGQELGWNVYSVSAHPSLEVGFPETYVQVGFATSLKTLPCPCQSGIHLSMSRDRSGPIPRRVQGSTPKGRACSVWRR